MSVEPSIKGALIVRLVEDARALIEGRGGEAEQLEADLSPGARALLETKIELGSWYPITQYAELTNLLWKHEGHGDPDYLRQRGANAMKRMMEAGLYQQLDYLSGGRGSSADHGHLKRSDVMRSTRLVGSITGAILNFTRQTWEWDPGDSDFMLHHIYEARDVPEAMRHVNEGAETFLVRIGRPDAPPVVSERPTPDHIFFRYDYRGAFEDSDRG